MVAVLHMSLKVALICSPPSYVCWQPIRVLWQLSYQGVSLPAACLTVSKDARVEATQAILHCRLAHHYMYSSHHNSRSVITGVHAPCPEALAYHIFRGKDRSKQFCCENTAFSGITFEEVCLCGGWPSHPIELHIGGFVARPDNQAVMALSFHTRLHICRGDRHKFVGDLRLQQ